MLTDFTGYQVLLGFVDPSGLRDHPGWPLRNLLAYANVRLGLHRVQILCLRNKLAKNELSSSLLLNVELEADAFYTHDGKFYALKLLSKQLIV
jgi:Ubiquitin-like modifier-activating enzyme ATG7 N-terminus